MGGTKYGTEQVATPVEQIESGNRYPDFVAKCCEWFLCVLLISVIPALLIWLLYSKFTHDDAPYSLNKDVVFKNHMKTNEYGIDYYVRSRGRFDKEYPVGTPARADFEKYVIVDYIQMEQEICHEESGWMNNEFVARQSFPACDRLRDMGINPFPKEKRH